MSRFEVVGPWHGAEKTLWHVYDNQFQEWVDTTYSREAAQKLCEVYNRIKGEA